LIRLDPFRPAARQDDSGLSEAIAAARVSDAPAPLRLSAQALAAARAALGPGADREVLVTHLRSGIDMTRKLIRCLRPQEWLNDEVMNLYMGLLQARVPAGARQARTLSCVVHLMQIELSSSQAVA